MTDDILEKTVHPLEKVGGLKIQTMNYLVIAKTTKQDHKLRYC